MARKVTLKKLKQMSLRWADTEDLGDIDETNELVDYINEEIEDYIAELAGLGYMYQLDTHTITADGSTAYELPDFSGITAVSRVSANDYIRLHPINVLDTEVMRNTNTTNLTDRYAVVGHRIEFYPTPTSGTFKVRYVPMHTLLADDTDTFRFVPGGAKYVAAMVGHRILMKQDVDHPFVLGAIEDAWSRMMRAINNTDLGDGGRTRVVHWDDEGVDLDVGWMGHSWGDGFIG